jgi:hypothetical protein
MDFPWNMWPDPPREWQVRAYETLIPMVRGRRCVMAQACTGAGKTRFQLAVIANVLATLRPGWVIVVSVPKQSLVEQTYEAARAVLPSGSVGRWYGNRKDPSRVTVVCHASAGSFVDYLGSQSQRIAFWMADEAHRADGDVLVEVIQRANPYTRLGLTATPFPPTGSAALRGWEEIAFRYTLDEAVRDGVLVPFRFVQFDRSNEDANEAVIEMIHRDAPPGPGLVSATDIVDAEWYAGQLSDNGIPAVAVHSKLRKGEEAKRIAALLRGEYRAMVHVDLLTEGRDIPGLRWLAARRPRGSAIAIAQEAGRISRVCRDDDPTVAWAGPKTEAVILMPRYVPVLESVMQVGEVTPELTAERLQAAAEREAAGPPREVVLPLTEAVGAFVGFLQALLAQAAEEGIRLEPDPEQTPEFMWRARAPTRMQFALLEDLERDPRKGAVKYLPKSGREVVREVLKRPGILTCGEVQDLLRLLRGVRSYAVKYAEQRHYLPVERRFWRGMQEAKAVLDPAAERSLRGGG